MFPFPIPNVANTITRLASYTTTWATIFDMYISMCCSWFAEWYSRTHSLTVEHPAYCISAIMWAGLHDGHMSNVFLYCDVSLTNLKPNVNWMYSKVQYYYPIQELSVSKCRSSSLLNSLHISLFYCVCCVQSSDNMARVYRTRPFHFPHNKLLGSVPREPQISHF